MKKLTKTFKSKYLSIETKIKQFHTYIDTVFLYNSEVWTTTPTINKQIDAFHRRLLRTAINKTWPKHTYTNEQLYEITKVTPWSTIIKNRRLNWTGHLFRLPKHTPARRALEEAARPTQRKPGRPPANWLSCVKRDLQSIINLPADPQEALKTLDELAGDRDQWRGIVKGCSTVRKD